MDLPPATAPSFSSSAPLAAADALLDALPWGVLVLDAQDVLQRLNQQAAAWCGAPAEALLGQPLAQAPLPAALGAALQQLPPEGAAPREVWLPGPQQWLSLRAAPAPAGQRWVFLEDTTVRHQAEAAQQHSSQLLLDMEEVARTGSYEADLASGSFHFSDGLYRLFGEAPQAFKVTLAVIDARSHPADAATVQQVLAEAVRTRQPYTYRRRIRRPDGLWRTLEAHGEVRCDAAGQPVQLRGLVQDITERVQAEQQQRESHELLRRTINSSLDLVQVFEAVRDEQGEVVDFTWVLNNDAAERQYGDVLGQRLCQLNPGVVPEGIFDTFRQVLETGVPDQRERHYAHEQFDGWFYQSTVKLGDGVATTTHDISARKHLEQELRETKELLQSTLDSSHYVVQVFKAVRDAQGIIVDFTWVLTNQVWLKQYGGPMTGKRLLQENPGVVETGLFKLFVQVTETGESVDHEQYYAHEQFEAWFHQTLVRMGDGFVMNTIDITERKRAQEEIISLQAQIAQQATDKYQVLFNSIDEGYALIELLYDEGGRVTDFLHLEVNPTAERLSGFEHLVGRRIRELLPDVEAYWLALYERVAATGAPVRVEHHSATQNRWFSVYASRVGGAGSRLIAAVFDDITTRKQAEQRQQYVMQLNDALRPLADPLAIQREALAVLRAHLGGTRTLYAEALDQEGTMYISTEDRDPGLVPMEGLVMRFQDFTPDGLAEAQAGRPLWRRDVRDEAPTPEQLAGYAAFGTRAWLMVPLVKNGHLVADLTVHSATARAWTVHDIALVQETTERTWAAVERARAEEALRASETQFRAVANLVPDLLWRSSPDSKTTWYSQRWHEYTGQTLADAAGDGWKNVIHPDDQAESSRCYQAAIAAGQPLRLEHRIRSAQGEYRWFQVRATPLRSEHGAVTEWFGAATDIHDRRLAEDALRQSEEKYRTLFNTIDEGFALMEVLPDEHGRVTDLVWREANAGMERHAGLGGWVGKRATEIMPLLEQGWLDALTSVYQTGEPVRMEAYNADIDRWIDTYYARMGSAGSPLIAAVFNNITERKQREQQQEFLLKFLDALRAEPTADAVALRALHLLSEQLRLDRCYMAEYHLEADHADFTHQIGNDRVPPLPAGGIRLSDFPEAMRTTFDRTLVIDDVAETKGLSDTDRRNIGALGLGALVAVTLRKGAHRPHWVLVSVSATPRHWTPGEIALLEDVAERTWAAMERAKIEEELRASEEKYRRIFENIDQGFSLHELLVDESGQVTDVILQEANAAFEQQTGLKHAQGKKISELVPNLEPVWLAAMARAYKWGETQHFEAYNTDTNRWLTSQYSRIGGAGSRLLTAVFTDITERKQREQHQEFLLKLSDALRPVAASAALERAALRVLRETLGADRVFLATVNADSTAWSVREEYAAGLPGGTGSYPMSAFQLKRLPQWQAGHASSVADSETDPTLSAADRAAYAALGFRAAIGVPLVKRGRFTALLCVNQALPRRWTAAELALASEAAERIWVALERARAEEALAASEQRLRALIANLPGAAAFVVGPDLRYQLAGGEALAAAGLGPPDLLGRTVAEAMPPELVAPYEAHYRQALAGQVFSLEHTAHGRTFISRGVPLLDAAGQPEAVLVVSYDITARKQAEEALLVSEMKYRTLFETMDQGFGIGQVLPADAAAGTPLDWQWLEVNPQFERLTGLPRADVLARTTRQLIPGLEEIWYERYAQAAAGETVNFESYSPVLDRWFDVYAFALGPLDNRRVAVLFSNTSEQKQVEAALREAEARHLQQLEQQVRERTQQLQANRDLLQSVLDTSLISMSVLQAERDEAGQVLDFRLGLVNKELERETGRTDLVGKLYAQEYPGVRQVGIFDLMLRALATDEPQGMEYFYDHEGFSRWFACQFVRLGDGLVATNLDITERKTAEQERLKNLRLLEQAEAVAGLGSWDYDLVSGAMRWSEGMYHLLHLPLGQPVSPAVYLALVADDDRPRAEQLVRQLTSGHGVEQTLRLRVGEHLKTVRLKAVVLRDEAGQPTRVLGVDLDISELQRLEADNLRLRLGQQQALFEAVQAAQEAERKRMAESLHNGIGQILYATKLRLDYLPAPLAGTATALATARQEANQLLSEAIRQTRALSHELVPLVLNDFGLAAALQDICRKLGSAQLHLHCYLDLDEAATTLAPPLQLALYRIAQELAQNTVKHARGATEATLELETMPGWVLLRMEDNGAGFAAGAANNPGLGLRSIRDRVALLGGQLEIGSLSTGGAYVRIRIPLLPAP